MFPIRKVFSVERNSKESEMRRYILLDSKIFSCLNPYEIALYTILSKYKNAKGDSFPSRRTLTEKGGFSISTYTKYIKKLIKKGLIKVKARWRANGSQTSNLFSVANIDKGFFIHSDILNKKLTVYELTVLIYLCSRKNNKNKCYVSQKEIAKACGMSVRQVGIIIYRLRKKGFINTRMQFNLNNRGNYVLEYTVCICSKSEIRKELNKELDIIDDFNFDMRDNIKIGIIKSIR